ncbi:MAG: M1 family metallopeptidase [Bacteroidia bacterium]|nr:M1 family metallopeptidase [Bacteroidia bacterium]MCF8425325.1 M1 family metallopeptidase [Bacteroidia bacterium]MCF8446098.1 M1 family metallopeptidase [Bacteroidia bacterium]
MTKLLSVFGFLLTFLLPVFLQAKNPKIRKSYDVISYQIVLKVNPDKKWIEGSNTIKFKALKNMKSMELDLFPQMKVLNVSNSKGSITFSRDSFTFSFPYQLKKGDSAELTVAFEGSPIEAKKAPWDGGFVWAKDSSNNPWVGLACEGLGASCWLPCKDQWDDEPESISVKLIVPKNLVGVSNGQLLYSRNHAGNLKEFNWVVNSPINVYNISINVGDYEHLPDVFVNSKGQQLTLNYYVLKYNVRAAKTHFQQVKRMLKTFEKHFGPYPFYLDGYKLVETPYWGMEHQSCIAYGNNFKNNKFGFDFIIIHESGHEWFANSITAADKSDMWIHESFTTYSESIYVEDYYGTQRATNYLVSQKGNIKNQLPIIGPKGVNYNRPDNDIYYKGAWMLHTMRNMLDNDTLWFQTLLDLNKTFYHQIVTTEQIEDFLSIRTRYNFKPFFDQYLRVAELPTVEYFMKEKNGLNELHYRLVSKKMKLKMPIRAILEKGKYDYLEIGPKWRIIDLPYIDEAEFKLDERNFLIQIKKINPN